MAISFENALGIHPQALELRVKRAELMANNLANADTPGFKARDIDFKAVLQRQLGMGDDPLAMVGTQPGHLSNVSSPDNPEVLYRTPLQPSIDGNTVDEQQELAAFTKNVMDYQASFQFLNSKFQGITKALKGE